MSEHSLINASKVGNLEEVELLISKGNSMGIEIGIDINKKDYYGYTPLYWASLYGRLEVVKLLISKGANVNEKIRDGGTPLHKASRNCSLEIAKLLILNGKSMGIDIVNKKDYYGYTPLYYASHCGHLGLMELLISHDADCSEIMEIEQQGKDKWKDKMI